MKIFVYWNYKDKNSKKIYSFLDSEKFEKFSESLGGSMHLHKKYQNFPQNDCIFSDLQNSNVAFFFTHGTENSILKFQCNDPNNNPDYTFIDTKNYSLLQDKVVIAICCDSLKGLGTLCTNGDTNACKAYVGFSGPLEYGNGGLGSNDKFRNLIYTSYSEAFCDTIIDAFRDNDTVKDFVKRLRAKLTKIMYGNVLKSANGSFGVNSINNTTFIVRTEKALGCKGNEEIPLFS
jgi:hypothetical protein